MGIAQGGGGGGGGAVRGVRGVGEGVRKYPCT